MGRHDVSEGRPPFSIKRWIKELKRREEARGLLSREESEVQFERWFPFAIENEE